MLDARVRISERGNVWGMWLFTGGKEVMVLTDILGMDDYLVCMDWQ